MLVQICSVFFFNDTATTEIYTLSLHDALPIYAQPGEAVGLGEGARDHEVRMAPDPLRAVGAQVGRQVLVVRRSEEHTSELQSQSNLVCRLLLEKKKNKQLDQSGKTLEELRNLC